MKPLPSFFRTARTAVAALCLAVLCGAVLPQAVTFPIPGLIHRWTLDESVGPTADDAVGPKDGTHTNAPTVSTANLPPLLFANGACLSFDGVDDHLAVSGGLADVLGNTASLSFWIETTQAAATANPWECPGVTGVEQASGASDIFWGFLDNTGRIGIQAGDGAAAKSAAPVNDGSWHHVVVTRDGASGQVQCFVDGALDATATSDTGAKTTPFSGIGRIEDTGGGHDHFSGRLDDVRIYNRVLSLAEIQVLASGADGITSPLAAPTGLSAVPGNTQVALAWNLVGGATGYIIRISTSSGGPYTDVATVNDPTNTYTVTGLTNSTLYYFVVAAFNDGGNGPNSAEVSAMPVGQPRTNDHEEGLLGDRCACGSIVPPDLPGLGALLALLCFLAVCLGNFRKPL